MPATKKTAATKSTSKPATKATSSSKSTSKTTPATKTVVTELSVSGNKKIKSLETEFDTVFGIYAQVCYNAADGHRYYTSDSADDKTLSSFNAECEKNGCKKGA